jgi:hypothetical protein
VFATNRLRRAAPLAAVLGAVVAALLVEVHPWPRHGVDQIRHLVNWPACASITVEPVRGAWPHAEEDALIDCEMLGPWVRYARFKSPQALKTDLLAASPDSAVCIYGDRTEVAVNGLEAHQFPALCRALHGVRVDGVVGLPDIPGGVTGASNERAARRQSRRDTTAEHQALSDYFRPAR